MEREQLTVRERLDNVFNLVEKLKVIGDYFVVMEADEITPSDYWDIGETIRRTTNKISGELEIIWEARKAAYT